MFVCFYAKKACFHLIKLSFRYFLQGYEMLGFISIYPSFLSPTTLPLPTQYMCVKCHPQYLSHLRGSSNKSVLQIWEDEILYILLKCSYMQTNFINIVHFCFFTNKFSTFISPKLQTSDITKLFHNKSQVNNRQHFCATCYKYKTQYHLFIQIFMLQIVAATSASLPSLKLRHS